MTRLARDASRAHIQRAGCVGFGNVIGLYLNGRTIISRLALTLKGELGELINDESKSGRVHDREFDNGGEHVVVAVAQCETGGIERRLRRAISTRNVLG